MVAKFKLRLYLFALVMLAGFGVLLYRLWGMQIDQYDHYVNKIPGTREERVRLPGVRGEIKDRNGVTLVKNSASYDIVFDLRAIVKSYLDGLPEGEKVLPKYTYTVNRGGRTSEQKATDIVKIVNETVHARLENLGLAGKYSATQLRSQYLTTSGYVPWTYRRGISFDEFAILQERNLDLPGVDIAVRPIRVYPFESLACHILGYVSLPDESKVPSSERNQWNYFVGDNFGIAGIELTRDEDLRGIPGTRTILKDEKGHYKGEVSFEPPRPGSDVYLTIDARIQVIVERALRDAKIGRGAAVVMDPNTGDILGMASVPSFNPNKFIPKIHPDDWKDYTTNPIHPLLNRAVQGFAPGSTYKIPVSLAGCLTGIDQMHLNCAGGVQYGNKFMRCWIHDKGGAHGTIDLSEAIMRSCNAYYYQYGNIAGIKNIVTVGNILGLGKPTGIELDQESGGILPSPRWLKLNRPGEVWTSGTTANVSIGQGDVLATPLQMASVTTAVANGGKVFQPRLIDRTLNHDGSEGARKAIVLRKDLVEEGVTPEDVERVRRGMWKVVNEEYGSTGRRAQIEDVGVSGKTGTAQFFRIVDGVSEKDNHTWFISFAPYDDPKFVVCSFVQGGKSGGGTAAPIAKRILERSLALEDGSFRPDIGPIPEVRGNFDFVELVEYPDEETDPELAEAEMEDGDVGMAVEARETVEAPPVTPPAVPAIQPDENNDEIIIPRAIPVTTE